MSFCSQSFEWNFNDQILDRIEDCCKMLDSLSYIIQVNGEKIGSWFYKAFLKIYGCKRRMRGHTQTMWTIVGKRVSQMTILPHNSYIVKVSIKGKGIKNLENLPTCFVHGPYQQVVLAKPLLFWRKCRFSTSSFPRIMYALYRTYLI